MQAASVVLALHSLLHTKATLPMNELPPSESGSALNVPIGASKLLRLGPS